VLVQKLLSGLLKKSFRVGSEIAFQGWLGKFFKVGSEIAFKVEARAKFGAPGVSGGGGEKAARGAFESAIPIRTWNPIMGNVSMKLHFLFGLQFSLSKKGGCGAQASTS
jgi:hypothetical protein